MKYLHTMVRVRDLDASLDFYCGKLGMREVRRIENDKGRFTLVFLAAPADVDLVSQRRAPMLELTYNWDDEEYRGGRNFGHLAFEVDDIYDTCARLRDGGVTINRPPRDGRMAFVRSPDGISVELLQSGDALRVARAVGVDAQYRRVVDERLVEPCGSSRGHWREADRRFGAEDGYSHSTQKCGFQATSQRKPSGSAK